MEEQYLKLDLGLESEVLFPTEDLAWAPWNAYYGVGGFVGG